VLLDAKIEDELKDFDGAEKEEMRQAMGESDDGINDLITAGYKLLGLDTYFYNWRGRDSCMDDQKG
jgi:ribosome-binding ATPase YchF (GTP1/OBG family)